MTGCLPTGAWYPRDLSTRRARFKSAPRISAHHTRGSGAAQHTLGNLISPCSGRAGHCWTAHHSGPDFSAGNMVRPRGAGAGACTPPPAGASVGWKLRFTAIGTVRIFPSLERCCWRTGVCGRFHEVGRTSNGPPCWWGIWAAQLALLALYWIPQSPIAATHLQDQRPAT